MEVFGIIGAGCAILFLANHWSKKLSPDDFDEEQM